MSTPGTSLWRSTYWQRYCKEADLITIAGLAPGIRLTVASEAKAAYYALFNMFSRHGYQVRPGVTGAYNCRVITGGKVPSAHAFGIAVDVNWDTNPYTDHLITDMPMVMIKDIMGITTADGVRVWRWGGDWDNRPETTHSKYDAMHFEVIATPTELARGIECAYPITADPRSWYNVVRGFRGPAVERLQGLIGAKLDGVFGPNTEKALKAYQMSHGLKADGIAGRGTWTALFNQFPKGTDYGKKGS